MLERLVARLVDHVTNCSTGGGQVVQFPGHSHGGAGMGARHEGHTDLHMLATLRARYDKEATG